MSNTQLDGPFLHEALKVRCGDLTNLRLIVRPSLVYLVCTVGKNYEGCYLNVAPYSLIMEGSHNPPRILLGVRDDNDTHRNIIQGKEFTINLCSPINLSAVQSCSEKL